MLTILLFIFCSCSKAQTHFLGVRTLDYNVLIDRGTFEPSETLTDNVSQYINYDYGWLIDFTMSTYNGHWADQRTETPPAPADFDITNVNVEQWAIEAEARGVQYAPLTVFTEYGFLLYPSEVNYPMSQISLGSGLSPYYTDPYCVQPGADQRILDKFVREFDERGIEPCFYFGFGGNSNLAQITSGNMWDAAISDARKELFVQYYCLVAQELARKWPRVKYYWVDMAQTGFPANALQRLYNAFKSINPDIVIIGNAVGETDFGRYPYDVASVEEYIAYGNPSFVSGNTLSHSGTTYYIPREIVGTPYSDYSQWYYYDEFVLDPPVNNPFTGMPPYVKMQSVSTATFQGLVDVARAANRPFLAAMLVDRDGVLVQDNLDFLDTIYFTGTP